MSQTHQPTMQEMVSEMRRLAHLLMYANSRYLAREEVVTRLHREGKQNYSGDLSTVLDNDLLLRGHSGLAKTCAALAGGLAQVIQAELSLEARQVGMLSSIRYPSDPKCICGADETTHLSHTFACRNQERAT